MRELLIALFVAGLLSGCDSMTPSQETNSSASCQEKASSNTVVRCGDEAGIPPVPE